MEAVSKRRTPAPPGTSTPPSWFFLRQARRLGRRLGRRTPSCLRRSSATAGALRPGAEEGGVGGCAGGTVRGPRASRRRLTRGTPRRLTRGTLSDGDVDAEALEDRGDLGVGEVDAEKLPAACGAEVDGAEGFLGAAL